MSKNKNCKRLCLGSKRKGKSPVYLCVHPDDNGVICGFVAKIYDHIQGGMVCLRHAPSALVIKNAA